jgi:hypothetical protein
MRQWLVGVLVGAVVGGLTAAGVMLLFLAPMTRAAPEDQTQSVVRAQRFELRDRNGVLRGVADLGDEGSAILSLLDQDGAEGVRLSAGRRGADIGLGVSRAPNYYIRLAVSERPGAAVTVAGHEGAVAVSVKPSGPRVVANQPFGGEGVMDCVPCPPFQLLDVTDPDHPVPLWLAP